MGQVVGPGASNQFLNDRYSVIFRVEYVDFICVGGPNTVSLLHRTPLEDSTLFYDLDVGPERPYVRYEGPVWLAYGETLIAVNSGPADATFTAVVTPLPAFYSLPAANGYGRIGGGG